MKYSNDYMRNWTVLVDSVDGLSEIQLEADDIIEEDGNFYFSVDLAPDEDCENLNVGYTDVAIIPVDRCVAIIETKQFNGIQKKGDILCETH